MATQVANLGEEAALGWGEHLRHRFRSGLTRHATPGSMLYTASVNDASLGRAGLASGFRAPTSLLSRPIVLAGPARNSAEGLDKEVPGAALHTGLDR